MVTLTAEERDVLGLHRRLLRTRARLTRRELAEASGVSESSIKRAEAGEGLTEDNLRALASALGVSLSTYVDPSIPVSATPAGAER